MKQPQNVKVVPRLKFKAKPLMGWHGQALLLITRPQATEPESHWSKSKFKEVIRAWLNPEEVGNWKETSEASMYSGNYLKYTSAISFFFPVALNPDAPLILGRWGLWCDDEQWPRCGCNQSSTLLLEENLRSWSGTGPIHIPELQYNPILALC